MRKSITVTAAVITLTLSMMGAAIASSTLLDPFTATELENWTADRAFPSGGVTSVSAHGRSDVAQIDVVGELRSTLRAVLLF